LKFCGYISENQDERKKFYIEKFKNFLLELGLKLIDSFKYSVEELTAINHLATLAKNKKEKENDENEDSENDGDSYDENDNIQRELNIKKQLLLQRRLIN